MHHDVLVATLTQRLFEVAEMSDDGGDQGQAIDIDERAAHSDLRACLRDCQLQGVLFMFKSALDTRIPNMGGCILADQLWNLKTLQKRQFCSKCTLKGHVDAATDDAQMEEEKDCDSITRRQYTPNATVQVSPAALIKPAWMGWPP